MNGRSALELRGVTVRFGARAALEDVSLAVRRGEFVALAGPNGSGKSTLLRVALGTRAPDGGEARLFDRAVPSLTVRERALRVAWVPQEEPIRDNVRIGAYVLYGRFAHLGPLEPEGPADRAAAEAALAAVGLSERREDGLLEVSGGERQRLVLARALAQDAPLLLLDEPTAHLDIGHQLDLLARVRKLVVEGGRTAVAAIHDLNLAARFADRIVVLSKGRVVADGPPARVLSASLLRTVWGVAADVRVDARSGLPYLLPRSASDPAPGPDPASGTGPVHVVGGGGAGAEWMRALAERGIPVTAGALHLLDSDAEVAEALGIPVALEAPFAPLSEPVRDRNRALLAEARAIVIAPFAVGPSNLGNLEDVLAAPPGIPRYLAGSVPDERLDFTGGPASELRRRIAAQAVRVETPEALPAALEGRDRP